MLRWLDLRGRRLGQAVVLFIDRRRAATASRLPGARAVPIDEAAEAVLAALSQEAEHPAGIDEEPQG